MPVGDVDAILKAAVAATLVELVGDDEETTVIFHVAGVSHLDYCDGTAEEADEEDQHPHFIERMVWRLSLYITNKGKYTSLTGVLPYSYCFDGDAEPLNRMVRKMWQDFQFSHLLRDEDLDKELERVAAEVEKET